jgi:hypothetical protein
VYVALPFVLIAQVGFDIVPTLIRDDRTQSDNTDACEVKAVLGNPGVLACTLEACASLPVGNLVGRGTVALIDE